MCHREPVEITEGGQDYCGRAKSCFELKVPPSTTMLQAYNCERQRGPKKEVMPAEKQVRSFLLPRFDLCCSLLMIQQSLTLHRHLALSS